MSLTEKFGMMLTALFLMQVADSAFAAPSDPAVAQVRTLNKSLLKSMRAARAESMAARYRNLEPVIEQVFALPLTTHLAVGLDWSTFSLQQQTAMIAAYTRLTIANYANFRQFDGQKFEINDDVQRRGSDKIVRTRIIPAHDMPVNVLYRMQEVNGVWRIVDVYSNGVSALALQRSEFTAVLASGGPAALIARLNQSTDSLVKSLREPPVSGRLYASRPAGTGLLR
jgi:phospholipid transport system substrate-binding protein